MTGVSPVARDQVGSGLAWLRPMVAGAAEGGQGVRLFASGMGPPGVTVAVFAGHAGYAGRGAGLLARTAHHAPLLSAHATNRQHNGAINGQPTAIVSMALNDTPGGVCGCGCGIVTKPLGV